jgi:hypothetical protein
MDRSSARSWAYEEFGHAALGDARRTARLVAIGRDVAVSPSGRVSAVFRDGAARQAAYDWIESGHVDGSAILAACVTACARRCAEHPFVFVPLDGTSLHLTDESHLKGFGSVGSRERGARGLKIIDAIAVTPNGIPIGIAAMQWWARPRTAARSRHVRSTQQKETQHWLDAIAQTTDALERDAPSTHAWFQLDREGDAQYVLEALAASGHAFTVRSQSDRQLHIAGNRLRPIPGVARRKRYLRSYLARQRPLAHQSLEVPERAGQPARLACVAIRAATVTFNLHDRRLSQHRALTLNAVWVREHGGGPMLPSRSGLNRRRALDWLLLTNQPIETVEQVEQVVYGYTQRWRIEDFHRAWKTGVCNVEDTQLRSRSHVIKWATVLAAVAVRAERLKHLSREQPDAPASNELSSVEIEALILLKRRYAKRTEVIDDVVPTLERATRWIAEIGGYTGKSSGGPPGSVTIARGLERLRMATEILEALHPPKKKR